MYYNTSMSSVVHIFGLPGREGRRQREALDAARAVIGALMRPGGHFPTRAELERAWALIRKA